MSLQTRSNTTRKFSSPYWKLASVALTDADTKYILSRKAMQCTSSSIVFFMPRNAEKRLPYLTAEQLTKVLSVCNNVRD